MGSNPAIPTNKKMPACMAGIFDEIFISARLGVAKPHPDFFHLTQRKLNISFSQMCLIDDSEENIMAAKALGMNCILFKNIKDLE